MFSSTIFAQKEANWWHFGHHIAMNFSSGTPVYSFTSSITTEESCATISDSIGNLQFYTNGDTIWDRNNNIMLNGDLYTLQQSSSSTTEGAIIVMKPKSLSKYYVFSLGYLWNNYLKYAEVDMSLNAGNGVVTSKNNVLLSDTLTEKMTATKHSNNSDVWVVVVNCDNVSFNNQNNRECSFLSYLITPNGINPCPVITKVTLPNAITTFGQMKFNPQGNVLAWADPNNITLFNFNKTTGQVALLKNISTQLVSGYGLEFSPDGKFIYVSEKQYDLQSNHLTDLMDYTDPSQMQMGIDGKIYKYHHSSCEITQMLASGAYIVGFQPFTLSSFRLSRINQPNNYGISSGLDTNFILNFSYSTPHYPIGLPNFPSYYFYHPKGEFAYSGVCSGNVFQFYLKNQPVLADSVKWFFHDTNQSVMGYTVSHTYTSSGLHQVSCILYNNGIADTTTQFVTVCGKTYSSLPRNVDLCYGSDTTFNTLSPCGQKYKWSTGDTTSTIRVNASGDYIIQTTTFCGIYEDTITVDMVYCDSDYEIPNIFTPNNDGVNDIYSVRLKNIKSIKAYFYNRWGNEIYSKAEEVNITSSQRYNLWDGKTFTNSICENGTYYYIILMTDFKGNGLKEKGFLTLLSK